MGFWTNGRLQKQKKTKKLSPDLSESLTRFTMIAHQVKIGNVKEGDTLYLKWAGDGTAVTRAEVATVTTLSLADERRTLMVGTISIVLCAEKYEVGIR